MGRELFSTAQTVYLFGGGEVFLHPNWDELFEFAGRWAFLPIISTNGTLFNDQRIRALGGITLRGARQPLQFTFAGPTRFALRAPDASEVAIIGDFTDWQAIPLTARHGRWEVELDLSPGQYAYQYVVDGVPLTPPEATRTRPDGFGGINGVIDVSEK